MENKTVILEACIPIPEYTGFKNEETIHIKEGAFFGGHGYGYEVGRVYNDGEIKSAFTEDHENGNTTIFNRLRNEVKLIEKDYHFVNWETNEERTGIRYFLPYRVKGHCSTMPTVTDKHVDNCYNVEYDVTYEVLFVAEDGYKRYITVDYSTEGTFATCFYDHMRDVEDILEDMFENETNGFHVENDYRTVTFYDDAGDVCDIEISMGSVQELLSMIASIRVIKCEQRIIE